MPVREAWSPPRVLLLSLLGLDCRPNKALVVGEQQKIIVSIDSLINQWSAYRLMSGWFAENFLLCCHWLSTQGPRSLVSV